MFKQNQYERKYGYGTGFKGDRFQENKSYNKYNIFLNKKEKTHEEKIKEMDFPELLMNVFNEDTEDYDKGDYKNAIQTETEQNGGQIEIEINQGCLRIQKNQTGEIEFYKYSFPKKKDFSFHKNTSKIIDTMIERWDTHKNNYIELHGFDAYERMHLMPVRWIQNNFSTEDDEDSEPFIDYDDYEEEW
jgi:hypothetical protein